MVEKSFGLLFFLKQAKNQSDNVRFIYLKITVDGKPKELSTKRKCDVSKWNVYSGRATRNKEAIKELNSYLDALEQQVYQAKRRLTDSSKGVSAQAINDILTGNYEKPRMILDIFKQHNDQMKALEGIDYARGTIGRYDISFGHIKWFKQSR